MEEENIITVRNRNLQKADEAFADFMFMLESYSVSYTHLRAHET